MDDWRRKQRWNETEQKVGSGERTQATGWKMTESHKQNRSESRELTPGSIFIAEHHEEAADPLHLRPTMRCSSRGYWGITERYEAALERASNEEVTEADSLDAYGVTTCKSHAPIVVKDRKFIVLFVHCYHYVCIPLYTYNRRGPQGRPDESHHVSVFDCRVPSTLQQQGQSEWTPLQTDHMNATAHRLSLNAAARITFPVSRPKNLPMEVLGHLDPESTERLKDLFVVLNGISATTAEKQRLEAKHRDPTWVPRPPPRPQSLSAAPLTSFSASQAKAPSSLGFGLGLEPSGSTFPSPWTPKSTRDQGASNQAHPSHFPPAKLWPAFSRHSDRNSPQPDLDWTRMGADRATAAAAAEEATKAKQGQEDEEETVAQGNNGIGSADEIMTDTPSITTTTTLPPRPAATPSTRDKITRPWRTLKRRHSKPFSCMHAKATKPAARQRYHQQQRRSAAMSSSHKTKKQKNKRKREVDNNQKDNGRAYQHPTQQQPAQQQLRRSMRKRTKVQSYADWYIRSQ